MQFADPAWQPGTTQQFDHEQTSTAPQPEWSPASGPTASSRTAQQSGESEHDYTQGYRPQPGSTPASDIPFQNQQQTPPFQNQQPPFQGQQSAFFQGQLPWYKRMPVWAWWLIGAIALSNILGSGKGAGGSISGLIITIALIVLGWLLYTRRLRVNLGGETQAAETRTFEVNALPTLVINNKAGSIRLHAGQENQVSITTTKRGYVFSQGGNQDSQVWFNQDKATNTVSARVDGWKLLGKMAVDFDITVPPQATLELVTNAGNISVQNVSGQMKLQTDAGSINTAQIALRGKSRLKTDAGSITFDGSIEPAGDYEFSTNFGSITATLPTNSSFDLKASTDLGSVNTNLPLQQSSRTKASGKVGTGPTYPRLKLKTDLGSVTVYRN